MYKHAQNYGGIFVFKTLTPKERITFITWRSVKKQG